MGGNVACIFCHEIIKKVSCGTSGSYSRNPGWKTLFWTIKTGWEITSHLIRWPLLKLVIVRRRNKVSVQFGSRGCEGFASLYNRGHQRGARGHQVAHKDHVGPPGARSKNNISMVNVFTLTNVNTEVSEGKLSKSFISEVCIKLAALRSNRCTRGSS